MNSGTISNNLLRMKKKIIKTIDNKMIEKSYYFDKVANGTGYIVLLLINVSIIKNLSINVVVSTFLN